MNKIYRTKVIDAKTIAASGSYTSDPIQLSEMANNGQFSLAYELTGSGTGKFEYLMSYDGTYFFEPSAASDIASSITTASGSAAGMIRSVAFTSGGVLEPVAGDTFTGATSSATAKFISVSALSSGTWAGGDAAGTMYVWDQSGTFQAENINAGRQSNILTIGGNTAAYTAKDIVSFEPEVAPYMKIKATETAGASTITVTCYLIRQ